MTNLEIRQLGLSDLYITRVGIGTAPIGSIKDWRIYWGPQSESDAIRAIEAAIDIGINWIDTAPFYGWGRAEQIVGKALRGKRDKLYIFTKCGTLRNAQGFESENLTPASIRGEVESSLRNLQIDYIDLYQFHDIDPNTPIEESWATMQELIREGKVRYGGLSNHTVELMKRAMAIAPITSNQHQYNLLYRSIEQDVLPFSQRNNIGLLSWSPLVSGFLTDDFDLNSLDPQDFRRRHPYAQEPRYALLREVRSRLQIIAHDHQRTLTELATAWVLRRPAVTGAIIGIQNERDAKAMTKALDWKLSTEMVEAIEQALATWS
ncbi:MAG TPA: aldo/keto reductase [Ktedonobacteraceae bacterium]|nr:aldo/keto reductase [Ktedonobacteraceae bacterium]